MQLYLRVNWFTSHWGLWGDGHRLSGGVGGEGTGCYHHILLVTPRCMSCLNIHLPAVSVRSYLQVYVLSIHAVLVFIAMNVQPYLHGCLVVPAEYPVLPAKCVWSYLLRMWFYLPCVSAEHAVSLAMSVQSQSPVASAGPSPPPTVQWHQLPHRGAPILRRGSCGFGIAT